MDQTLLTSTPSVHGPGWTRATMDGPMLSLPCPRTLLVAVGSTNSGPMPTISLCGLAGVKKMVGDHVSEA